MARARVLEVGMPTVVFPIRRTEKDHDVIIGVDPHKLSHTATAVDPLTNIAVASLRIDASLAGYRELWSWAQRFPQAAMGDREREGSRLSLGPVAHRT